MCALVADASTLKVIPNGRRTVSSAPLIPGALYRIRWCGEWRIARYVAKDKWTWRGGEPLYTTPTEIGEPVIEVDWVRDPFAATVRMSAMVRV
jgi:hypothetical protein